MGWPLLEGSPGVDPGSSEVLCKPEPQKCFWSAENLRHGSGTISRLIDYRDFVKYFRTFSLLPAARLVLFWTGSVCPVINNCFMKRLNVINLSLHQ